MRMNDWDSIKKRETAKANGGFNEANKRKRRKD